MCLLTLSASAQTTEAKLLALPEYVMPAEATAAGIDGKVAVAVWVDKNGSVDRAQVLAGPAWPCSSNPNGLISKVRDGIEDTIKQARFSPAMKDGKPQSAELLLTFLIGNEYQQAKKVAAATAAGQKPPAEDPKVIRGGVINGKALSFPKPEYPAEARGSRVSGAVTIQVLIDEKGDVIRAGAINGHPLLQKAARNAACEAKFSPTLLAGQPVKVSGVITYNFVPGRPR